MQFQLPKDGRGRAALAGGAFGGLLLLAAMICVGYWAVTGNSLLMGSAPGDGLDESDGVYTVRVQGNDGYIRVCGQTDLLDRTRQVEFAVADNRVESVQLRVDFRHPPQSIESPVLREGELFRLPMWDGPYEVFARIVEGEPRKDGEPRVVVLDTDSYRSVPVREIASQAIRERLNIGPEELFILTVTPVETVVDGDQLRTVVYASVGTFEEGADGRKLERTQMTAPYEIYAVLNGDGQAKLTYCGGIIPPYVIAPEVWEELGIDESTFDMDMELKQRMQKDASSEVYERAAAFLKSDPAFADRVWERIIGEPLASAKVKKIEDGFREQMRESYKLYQAAVKQKVAEDGWKVTLMAEKGKAPVSGARKSVSTKIADGDYQPLPDDGKKQKKKQLEAAEGRIHLVMKEFEIASFGISSRTNQLFIGSPVEWTEERKQEILEIAQLDTDAVVFEYEDYAVTD